MFVLVLAALWFAVLALLGAVDWWRWRAPLDSALVYGPTFEARNDSMHGMYLPIVTALEEQTPIDAVVIVLLPLEPKTHVEAFFVRYASLLGTFVLPRRVLGAAPDTWFELLERVEPGTPTFVLDVLGLLVPSAELSELSRSDVHTLWRVENHG